MKSIFKSIILIGAIVCGVWYMVEFKSPKLEGANFNESEISLKEKNNLIDKEDKSVDGKNISKGEELMLVNETNGLDKNYIPKDLSIPNIRFYSGVSNEEKKVAGIIKEPLEDLVNGAKNDGITLLGISGYRSYKSQKKTYDERVKTAGTKLADAYVAKPGYSEHQTGLCMDITNEGKYFVKGTAEADWLDENCYKYGFIIRYPYGKKNITGIEYEPWHIRYVGKNAAKYIHDNGITLEEYLGE